MKELLCEQRERFQLPRGDPRTISFAARALAYGLARMYIDGQLAQWDVPANRAEDAFKAAFDLFVNGLAPASD